MNTHESIGALSVSGTSISTGRTNMSTPNRKTESITATRTVDGDYVRYSLNHADPSGQQSSLSVTVTRDGDTGKPFRHLALAFDGTFAEIAGGDS